MSQVTRPAIVVISSHVARGSVGNRAAVFALEALGFPVWAIPTVLLPWHPGHGPATRIVPDEENFSAFLTDLSGSKFTHEVGGILTGYMGSVAQVKATANFVRAMRAKNSDLFYVCDPVIGDNGGLYIAEEIATAIRDELLPLADLMTPNRFEFNWLMGASVFSNEEAVNILRGSKIPRALVTSAFAFMKGGTGNLYIDDELALLAEHKQLGKVPSGTGDLTAALFLGRFLAGQKIEDALSMATQSVSELLLSTNKMGADELMLETATSSLRQPTCVVQMRYIGMPQGVKMRVKPSAM